MSHAESQVSGQSYIPDKGTGKHAHTAQWQESNQQGSLETPAPETSFFTTSSSSWSDPWDDQQPASYGGYVQDMEQTDSSYYQGSPVAPRGQPVEIWKEPLHAILDLGCTRAMGSRVAVEAMLKGAASYELNLSARFSRITQLFVSPTVRNQL